MHKNVLYFTYITGTWAATSGVRFFCLFDLARKSIGHISLTWGEGEASTRARFGHVMSATNRKAPHFKTYHNRDPNFNFIYRDV